MHRKKIGEFLHNIRAVDAIEITEPFFCDASYNQIGKLDTLMVHVGVCNGGRDTCIHVPLCTLLLPLYLLLPLPLPIPTAIPATTTTPPLITTRGAPSISGRVGPG